MVRSDFQSLRIPETEKELTLFQRVCHGQNLKAPVWHQTGEDLQLSLFTCDPTFMIDQNISPKHPPFSFLDLWPSSDTKNESEPGRLRLV